MVDIEMLKDKVKEVRRSKYDPDNAVVILEDGTEIEFFDPEKLLGEEKHRD